MRLLALALLALAGTAQALSHVPQKPACYPPAHAHIESAYLYDPGRSLPTGAGIAWSCPSKFGFTFHNVNWRISEYKPALAQAPTKANLDAAWDANAWRAATDPETAFALDAFKKLRGYAEAEAPKFVVLKNGTSTTRPARPLLCANGTCALGSGYVTYRPAVGSACDCSSRVDIPSSATQAYCKVSSTPVVAAALCSR